MTRSSLSYNRPTSSSRPSGFADKKKQPAQEHEFEQIGEAIRRGQIDAFVTDTRSGSRVLVLQGAEHPYRVLTESVTDGTATLDAAGTVLYANNRLAKMLQIPVRKLLGTSLQSHFSPSLRRGLDTLFRKRVQGTRRRNVVLAPTRGKARTIRLSFRAVNFANLKCICLIATELTALVAAKGALQSNEESLRQLSARLLRVQDEERRRIARDLHDITGQKLAIQSITLAQVLKHSSMGNHDAQSALAECADLSKQISNEIRTLSYMLHPPLLDELGLASGIKWYVEGFERRTGIAVAVIVQPEFPRLSPDIELTLFRIVQESLTNVHRYSESPKAEIRIRSNPLHIRLEIRDFGKGMASLPLSRSSNAVAPMGVGIQGMKERMRQLSGELEIASRPGKGTVVAATLPLSRSRPAIGASPRSPAAAGKSSELFGTRAGVKRILLADDHETLRRGLRALLEEVDGWEVCGEAVDGEDAVYQVTCLRPDLMILDVNMPGLDGLAVIRKTLDVLPHMKVLVFTVHDSPQLAKEFQAAGAHAYLSKDKAGEELLNVVNNLLGGNSRKGPPRERAQAAAAASL